MQSTRTALAALILALACAPKQPAPQPPAPKPIVDQSRAPVKGTRVPKPEPEDTLRPMVPPEAAYTHGWMPLASTGVDKFLRLHPTHDGRGVIIGILDTGIDPGIPGLGKTSTDAPKILDLRDFSDEGAVPLQRVTPVGDSVDVGGHRVGGFGRVVGLNTTGPYYGGTIQEIPLGPPPASDLNGNGTDSDTLPVIVTKATDGWVLFADTDGDGSLAGERPVHDYLVARETFGWAARGRAPRLNVAVNFAGGAGEPSLDLVFDISSHGSHVAGIAAGHNLYGISGFDGVAPGAQLLGLKIANSAQGSVTTTGSMLRAIEYAIKFADARRLPLVLNLSFGVGNEFEGAARIDAMVDSILAIRPSLVVTISAGNDGPGLSTIGFPGSARRSISIGATLPASFLPPDPMGSAPQDQLAYFSSRGGELAKPDLVTPGVAYSTVPRWSTGQEIEQGTSMASPHAAGVAALLVSGLTQEKRAINALEIKQALMVTARPLPGATFVDEGTGVPEVEPAYRWLLGDRKLPDVSVRTLGSEGWTTAAYLERRPAESVSVQRFELIRSASAPSATYTLRSDVPWATVPARVTLSGPRTTVEVRYDLSGLKPPAAYTSTVTGWGADSLVGPIFRLVGTVRSPEPLMAGTRELRTGVRVEPGTQVRTFFRADSARPLEVRVSSGRLGQKGLAFLHEPDGMPYRDESARPIGSADREAVYQIDGRDVVAGSYEVVAVAPTAQPLTVNAKVISAPVRLRLGRDNSGALASLTNLASVPVTAEVAMLLGGGERTEKVVARGSAVRRIPFVAPAWARAVVIDLNMDRGQWGRFTDFGVTLFDSAGRQIEKKPLNYAFGRLQAKLPDGHGDMPVELGLFPGFADPKGDESWTVQASIRLYADSAVALDRTREADSTLTIAPGQTATASFTLASSPWPLGEGFSPLAVLVARADGHSWTREAPVPLPNSPMTR
jgi:tripeptidyl-peptidase II